MASLHWVSLSHFRSGFCTGSRSFPGFGPVISITLNGVVFSPTCGPEKTESAAPAARLDTIKMASSKDARVTFMVLEYWSTFASRTPLVISITPFAGRIFLQVALVALRQARPRGADGRSRPGRPLRRSTRRDSSQRDESHRKEMPHPAIN